MIAKPGPSSSCLRAPEVAASGRPACMSRQELALSLTKTHGCGMWLLKKIIISAKACLGVLDRCSPPAAMMPATHSGSAQSVSWTCKIVFTEYNRRMYQPEAVNPQCEVNKLDILHRERAVVEISAHGASHQVLALKQVAFNLATISNIIPISHKH